MERATVEDGEVQSAGKQTMETLKAGERIMEALEIVEQEKQAWTEFEAVSIKQTLATVTWKNLTCTRSIG